MEDKRGKEYFIAAISSVLVYLGILFLCLVGAANGWSKSGYHDTSGDFLILFLVCLIVLPLITLYISLVMKGQNKLELAAGFKSGALIGPIIAIGTVMFILSTIGH